jgi:hypothetical protein
MKQVKIEIVGSAKEEYKKLSKIVGQEISEGIISSKNQTLLRSIKTKFNFIENNPHYGEPIGKSKVPKRYSKLGLTSLYWVKLSNYWRMIYTLKGNEVEIISIVLDIFDHKKYDKIFKYK